MAICRQACPYNTLDGCKVKEYGGICQLTNTVQSITEYRMTNADRIRSMSDEELSEFLTHMNPTNCQDCGFSHGWRCQTETTIPILRNAKRAERDGSSSQRKENNYETD